MKLLVDMNLSPDWVAPLTEAGFATQHWSEVGEHRASDHEILERGALISVDEADSRVRILPIRSL